MNSSQLSLRQQRITLVVGLVASILFAVVAVLVSQRRPLPGDVAILQFIHREVPTALLRLFLTATELGNPAGIIGIVTVLAALLGYKRKYYALMLVVLSVILATVANLVIKDVFRRQRPSLWQSIIHAQSFSFPSGHAMASSALVFVLVYVTWRTQWRVATLLVGGLFMLLVGLSRLYFGVHYPSDVVAGWLASLAVVSLVVFCLYRLAAHYRAGPIAREHPTDSRI